MVILAPLLAVLLLAGCAAGPPAPYNYRPEQYLLVLCEGYDSALREMTYRLKAGLLDEDEIETVDEIRSVVTPICTAPEPPARKELVLIAQAAVARLILMRQGEVR